MKNRFASSTYVGPEAAASKTLERAGKPFLASGRAIDVEAIARQFCNVELMFIPDLNPSGKTLLGLYTPTLNAIMVNSDNIEVRQRFTIAHEIGHVQLDHSHGAGPALFAFEAVEESETFECTPEFENLTGADERMAGLRKRKEIRANKFAAHLLMPEGLVREVWREENQNLERTANALLVSKQSLGFRLRDLHLQ